MATYSDDFSGTLSSWTVEDGSWSITTGVLNKTNTDGFGGIKYSSAMDSDEYTTSVDVVKTSDPHGIVVAAPSGWDDGYLIRIQPYWESNGFKIVQLGAGSDGDGSTLASMNTEAWEDGTLEVTINGSGQISATYDDGTTTHGPISYTPASLPGRYVGLWGSYGQTQQFDNFSSEDAAGGGISIPVVMNHLRNQGIA